MESNIRLLLELQDIDLKIDYLKERKITIPREIENIKKEIEELEEEKEKFLQKIKDEILAQKRLEQEAEALAEQIIEFQRKSREVKTNEEYRAMMQQIEYAQRKKAEVEDLALQKMEEVQKLEKEKEEKLKEFEKTKAEKENEIAALQNELATLDDKIVELEDERKRKIPHIPKKELLLYERIRSKRGKAIVCVKAVRDIDNNITGYVCGGCHAGLPVQFINELKVSPSFKRCENCGRLIYWNEEEL